jgi:hypothetical protein
MMNNLIGFVPFFLALVSFAAPGFAEKIVIGDFTTASSVIDFSSSGDVIGDYYKPEFGVTFDNLKSRSSYNTGTGDGKSRAACNFLPNHPAGEVLFDNPVTLAGVYITTNADDTPTILTAYRAGEEVGSESFDTPGVFQEGSFAGIKFSGGFDKIIIAPTDGGQEGQFCMDNFQFETTSTSEGAGANGDPHFKTWRGQNYDFHGECDLVLLHNAEFESGMGLAVHIRTKLRRDMSYISSAALRIGKDVLEVASQGVYWFNGVLKADLPAEFSGFAFSHTQPTAKQHMFEVHLGGRERIKVQTYKDFVSVLIEQGESEHFGQSVGLMGDFEKGHMISRDGKAVIEDANAFGQDWQVLHTDPSLFQTLRFPQHPNVCTMPTPVQAEHLRRRLAETSSVDELAAEKACEHWGEQGKDDCVFDVLTTGDLEMAMVGAY